MLSGEDASCLALALEQTNDGAAVHPNILGNGGQGATFLVKANNHFTLFNADCHTERRTTEGLQEYQEENSSKFEREKRREEQGGGDGF